MDKSTEKRLDAVVEDDVRKGYRIKDLPADLQRELQEDGGPEIRRVRFTRLNPARRRKIAEVVQRQYHRDLKNPDILSHEQILQLVTERGEWSKSMQEEMKGLADTTNRQMGLLFAAGDSGDAAQQLAKEAQDFRDWLREVTDDREDHEALLLAYDRWLEYTSDRQVEYTEKYAASQERERYSVDLDFHRLSMACTDAERSQQLDRIDELRTKSEAMIRVQRDRMRLLELQIKHAKIFSDSVEQRRDNAEEMARMYFTTELVDDQEKPQGPLVFQFEDLWNFPEELVQWLLVESYFFQNGIPDEAREYLSTFGFLKAERTTNDSPSTTSESEPSVESPVPPTSKPDSEVAAPMLVASSE